MNLIKQKLSRLQTIRQRMILKKCKKRGREPQMSKHKKLLTNLNLKKKKKKRAISNCKLFCNKIKGLSS